MSRVPVRPGDEKDFFFQLLYLNTDEEVRVAYLNMLSSLQQYVPQLQPDVLKRAQKVDSRESMVVMMAQVMVMDDENPLAVYAQQHAHPKERLAYMRVFFRDFSSRFHSVKLSETRVPDFGLLYETLFSEYFRRRDNGRVFRDFYNKSLPLDSDRPPGK